jgi:tetratricopeptide (TPR) repeat protein
MAGYYDRAIPYIEKVLASQKAEPDGEKAELAKTLDYLGELKYLAGHYADAEPLLMESLSIREGLYGESNVITAKINHHLGVLYTLTFDLKKAFKFLSNAFSINKNNYGLTNLNTIETAVDLARCNIWLENLYDAEALISLVLQNNENILESDSFPYIKILNTTSWIYSNTGNLLKSEAYAIRAFLMCNKLFEHNHPYMAESLRLLGIVYCLNKDYDKSIEAIEYSLEILSEFFNENNPGIGMSLYCLAMCSFKQNELDKANNIFNDSLNIYENFYGKNHPRMAYAYLHLANLYKSVENFSEAAILYKKSIDIRYNYVEETPILVAKTLTDAAIFYVNVGDLRKSFGSAVSAKFIIDNSLYSNHPNVADNLIALGIVYDVLRDHEVANHLYDRAFNIIDTSYQFFNKRYLNNMMNLFKHYVQIGNRSKAKKLFNDIRIRITQNGFDKLHEIGIKDYEIFYFFGFVANEFGDYPEAIEFYNAALNNINEESGDDTISVRVHGVIRSFILLRNLLKIHHKTVICN